MIGAHFVTPAHGGWDRLLAQFQQGRFPAAKVMIPAGFGFAPWHVQDLIQAGAKTIILRGEDCDPYYERTRQDLVDRGFLEVIRANPGIDWWLEVGNEPEHCGMDHWQYRWALIDTIRRLRPETDGLGLRWVASSPVSYAHTRDVLSQTHEGSIAELYDAFGVHIYGHYDLDDGGSGDWLAIYRHLLRETGMQLWVTEAGINHAGYGMDEKAQRYLDWWAAQPHERIEGLVIFCLAEGSGWPQYELDSAGLAVLGARQRVSPEAPRPRVEQSAAIKAAPMVSMRDILQYLDSDPRAHAWDQEERGEFAYYGLKWCRAFGFTPLLMFGQSLLETDNLRFTGDVPADYYNIGGIGATGGVPGAAFPTIEDAWLAFCAHMGAYVWGTKEHWPLHLRRFADATPRHALVVAHPMAGKVRTLDDLGDGTWAEDPDYSDKIARKCNDILAKIGGD